MALKRVDLSSSFERVARAFAHDHHVTFGVGRGFGSGAPKFDGKIFAMISSKGKFVAKLPAERVTQMICDGHGQHFDAGRGKKMKEWLALNDAPELWVDLAKEARQFAGNK